jgi:hypothetical protein
MLERLVKDKRSNLLRKVLNYGRKKFYNIGSRSGEIEEEAIAHEGGKPSRAIYLKNGLVFTTGFTKCQCYKTFFLRR